MSTESSKFFEICWKRYLTYLLTYLHIYIYMLDRGANPKNQIECRAICTLLRSRYQKPSAAVCSSPVERFAIKYYVVNTMRLHSYLPTYSYFELEASLHHSIIAFSMLHTYYHYILLLLRKRENSLLAWRQLAEKKNAWLYNFF